jgi:hypothetical protein
MSIEEQETTPQLVRIHVVRIPFDDDCRVVPPIAPARKTPGDFVTWVNRTGNRITVFLPIGVVGGPQAFSIDDGSCSPPRSVAEGTPGVYVYQIACSATTYAKGNSAPIIIIE